MKRYNKSKHCKEKNKFVYLMSIIFLILIVGIVLRHIYCIYISKVNKNIYENIDKQIICSNEKIDAEQCNIKKMIEAKKINSDVVGWIEIDNTSINYPILQCNDNQYYLNHTYKGEESTYGSIFLKSNCDIYNKNSNLIIYGHNMKDGQMFNQIIKYEDKEYYNQHKIIKIATEQEQFEYEIISVFKSRVFYQDEKNVFRFYNYVNFENEKTYNEFIDLCKKIQLYDTGIEAKYGEQLVTLITCEYSQDNGRMVVVARKINK